MGDGFEIGKALGTAISQGVVEWRQIQLQKQQRQRFDGYMAMAAQRLGMIQSAAGVEEAGMLEQLKAQVQRSPSAQQTQRPTGAIRDDGEPETEDVIRTDEGDIPVKQIEMLKARKRQAENNAEVAKIDLLLEIQARDPDNPLVKQWVASQYAGIQARRQVQAQQIERQRLELDTLGAALEREKFDLERSKLTEQQRQFDAGPQREKDSLKAKTDEEIRQDAARISAQKAADIEVEGVRAQNKPERAPTEFDKKLRQMAPRAQEALQTIDALEQSSGEEVYDRTGLKAGLETVAPNAARSGKRQQYDQAALQLINSLLRAESGATITEAEISKAREQYIPRLGEAAEVVEQKRRARATAVRELFAQGGLEPPQSKAVGAGGGGLSSEEQALIQAVKSGQMSPDEARARRAQIRGR